MTCHSKLHSEQSGKALNSHFSWIASSSDNILNWMTEAISRSVAFSSRSPRARRPIIELITCPDEMLEVDGCWDQFCRRWTCASVYTKTKTHKNPKIFVRHHLKWDKWKHKNEMVQQLGRGVTKTEVEGNWRTSRTVTLVNVEHGWSKRSSMRLRN